MTRKNDTAIVRQASNALAVRPEVREEYITPAADIYETPIAFVLHLDLPGAARNGIQVSVEAEKLSIKARVEDIHAGAANILYHEILHKNYFRAFNLTKGIDSERIEAEFQDGVLKVTIPKSEQFRRKDIQIQ
jgi:HSP20 family molecular chaperone IbpA